MKILQRMGVFPYFLLGVALFIIGLLTVDYIVNNFWPFDVARLDLVRATALDRVDAPSLLEAANRELVFALLGAVLIAVTGLALPLAYVLNKRFGRYADERFGTSVATPFLVVLRQAMGVGFWVSFCLWLQMNRALGFAAALLVAAVLILFELLLQIRRRVTAVTQNA